MSLLLKIDQNDAAEFFSKYDLLTPLQQQIWKMAVWWVKKFPSAYPSQAKVAKKVGCSRKHVNQTFQRFIQNGWLVLASRGKNRTKILGIPKYLVAMDLFKREYFKKVEVTSEVTHSSSSRRIPTSTRTGCLFPTFEVPTHLQILKGLPLEAKLKLSLVPEHIYQEALYSSKLQAKKGKVFEDEIGYVVGTAIRMAQKQKIKLNWASFYEAKRKIQVNA